ncbi:hypothetical protein ElyMa_005662700 [Elysia marginata]|uniref:Galectin n=1 Tax=Elysia marginata TaxID=1093978 RepID=A0AAV4FD76_9GAST|nr:hypothetical protein ElyMa_005662700 [Elysia marginata]
MDKIPRRFHITRLVLSLLIAIFLGIPRIQTLTGIDSSANPPMYSCYYSLWPGQLEGCTYYALPGLMDLLGCARASIHQTSTTFEFNSDTGTCLVCPAERISGYNASYPDGHHFWLRRSRIWTGLATDTYHVTPIDGGLQPGMVFELFGTLQYKVSRFSVFWSSQTVVHASSDFAFKVQFFFRVGKDSQLVVMKAVVGGVTTKTEIELSPPVILLDRPFRVLVLVTKGGYLVYIDDVFCCEFPHKETNLSSVNMLTKAPSGFHALHSIVF